MKVFGPAGPKMTWEQRAEAGVPAEKFQAALASAMRQRSKGRATPHWSANLTEIFTISPFPGREACDFCSERPTTHIYPCKNFVVPRFGTSVFQHESIGGWAACSKCAELIDAGRWAELTDRALTVGDAEAEADDINVGQNRAQCAGRQNPLRNFRSVETGSDAEGSYSMCESR